MFAAAPMCDPVSAVQAVYPAGRQSPHASSSAVATLYPGARYSPLTAVTSDSQCGGFTPYARDRCSEIRSALEQQRWGPIRHGLNRPRVSRRQRVCVVTASGDRERGSGGGDGGGGTALEGREGLSAEGGLPGVGSGRRSRRRGRTGGSGDSGSGKAERGGSRGSEKEGGGGRRKWLPKQAEQVQHGEGSAEDDRTAEKQQDLAAREPLAAAPFSETDEGLVRGEESGRSAEAAMKAAEAAREAAEAAEYRRMERSFGEGMQEMDPEEIRLARQRVADLIRAGDDVEQEIVRMGREGWLTDALILVIQNRLNFARHDNERHVVQCLDLLLRRIEAEREAQQATPAMQLLNGLLHLADDLSADISTAGYDQWQREARDAMRSVFLPENPFTVVMPVGRGMGSASTNPWNEAGAGPGMGNSMHGDSTLLRIDFIREVDELLEAVEADAAAAAQVIVQASSDSQGKEEIISSTGGAIEQAEASWSGLDADTVALKLRLEERLRIIRRVRDLQHIAATLSL